MLNFISNAITNWWHTSVEGAPPPIRYVDIAYVKLTRKDGNQTIDVGSFVPELFTLANTPTGSLKCQMDERAWAKKKWRTDQPANTSRVYRNALRLANPTLYERLYRPDGQRKTAFELAVVPSHRIVEVERAVKREFKFRRDHRLALPPGTSKLRVIPDYLQHLNEAGLAIKEFPSHIKVNIHNPVNKMSLLEKILHYTGQWAALLLAITSGITGGLALYAGAPALIFGSILLMYLSKKCANDVLFFDVSEIIWRDLGWLTSKELGWQGRFSLTKSLRTGVYLAAVAIAVYLGAAGMWAMTMELPFAALAHFGLQSAVPAIQTALGGFLAVVGGAIAYAVGTATQRYFWGLSFWDTQIQFDKKMGDALVTQDTSKDVAAALKNVLVHAKHKIHKHATSKKENTQLLRDVERAFIPLIRAQEAKREEHEAYMQIPPARVRRKRA